MCVRVYTHTHRSEEHLLAFWQLQLPFLVVGLFRRYTGHFCGYTGLLFEDVEGPCADEQTSRRSQSNEGCSVLQCVASHLHSQVSFENEPLLCRALSQKRPVTADEQTPDIHRATQSFTKAPFKNRAVSQRDLTMQGAYEM